MAGGRTTSTRERSATRALRQPSAFSQEDSPGTDYAEFHALRLLVPAVVWHGGTEASVVFSSQYWAWILLKFWEEELSTG